MGIHDAAEKAALAPTAGADGRAAAARPLTRNEEMVYAQLRSARGPLKAYALLERLRAEGLRAPMTIYRALDSLIDRRLARRIVSLNAFVALTPETEAAIGAFITCTKCGRTRVVGIEEGVVEGLLAPAGMAISDVFIEAFGDCAGVACEERPVMRHRKGSPR